MVLASKQDLAGFNKFLKTFLLSQNFPGCPKTAEKILYESQYDHRFPAKNIFLNEKDVKGENYWLYPNLKKGPEAFFILDLGCTKLVSGFLIRNTHNAYHHDRGTQLFNIFGGLGEGDMEEGEVEWELVVDGRLEDPRYQFHSNPIPVTVVTLDKPKKIRWVRFVVQSFYGSGGGLQYFGYF